MNAAYIVPLVGITLMACGLLGVGVAAWRSHKSNQRLDFIRSLGTEAELYAEAKCRNRAGADPAAASGCFGPAAKGLRHNLSRLYPVQDIDRVHADLLKAGLTGSIRAEEFVAVQVGSVMLGIGIGLDRAGEWRRESEDWVLLSPSSCPCSEAWRRAGGCADGSRRGASR